MLEALVRSQVLRINKFGHTLICSLVKSNLTTIAFPGTELAHPVHPKASSYTLSAASKDMPKHSATNQSDNMINGEVASEIKTGNSELNPADKQAAVNVNVSEAAPESLSKGPRSPECASVVRDIVQEKQIAGEQGQKMCTFYSFSSFQFFKLILSAGKKKKKKKPGIPITGSFPSILSDVLCSIHLLIAITL